jgi:hypothetical protein
LAVLGKAGPAGITLSTKTALPNFFELYVRVNALVFLLLYGVDQTTISDNLIDFPLINTASAAH